MNNVQLIGRLTMDPSIRMVNQNLSVLDFTLAVNQRKSKNNPNPSADFIHCVAWNGVARIISNYCKKGTRIGIVGRLHTYSYERNGSKRYISQVIVRDVEFLDSPHKGEQANSDGDEPNPKLAEEFDLTEVPSKDIPF